MTSERGAVVERKVACRCGGSRGSARSGWPEPARAAARAVRPGRRALHPCAAEGLARRLPREPGPPRCMDRHDAEAGLARPRRAGAAAPARAADAPCATAARVGRRLRRERVGARPAGRALPPRAEPGHLARLLRRGPGARRAGGRRPGTGRARAGRLRPRRGRVLRARAALRPREGGGAAPAARDARRLVEAGGVRAGVPGEAWVRGSAGVEHRVRLADSACTCPWWAQHAGARGPCKHVLAARMALEGDDE